MKTTPISSQNLQAKMRHTEDLKKLEALRLDIQNTTTAKKVRAKKLLDKQAHDELESASILFSPDDNVVEYTTEKVKHARKTYNKKTTPTPEPTPAPTYDDKTRAYDDDDDNIATSTSTSTSIGDNNDRPQALDEKVSHTTTTTTTASTPTPLDDTATTDNEKVSQAPDELEKVSRGITLTSPSGHPLPLEVLLDKHKIRYDRLPLWFLQSMGSLSLTNLEKYVHLMGDDLPITEKIAADLLARTANGDKEATKIYWDLQKNLAKNPKIIQEKPISVKPDSLLNNAFDAIEAEVLDKENEP